MPETTIRWSETSSIARFLASVGADPTSPFEVQSALEQASTVYMSLRSQLLKDEDAARMADLNVQLKSLIDAQAANFTSTVGEALQQSQSSSIQATTALNFAVQEGMQKSNTYLNDVFTTYKDRTEALHNDFRSKTDSLLSEFEDKKTLTHAQLQERVSSMQMQLDAQVARFQEALRVDISDFRERVDEKLEDVLTRAVEKGRDQALVDKKVVAASNQKAGQKYEDVVEEVVNEVLVTLGGEYMVTALKVGAVTNSKKGDGVITFTDGGVNRKIVVEATKGNRKDWMDYLDEAERNRHAVMSVAITEHSFGGSKLKMLSPTRVLVSYVPEQDDETLVRTALYLANGLSKVYASTTDVTDNTNVVPHIEDAISGLKKVSDMVSQVTNIDKATKSLRELIEQHREAMKTSLNLALSACQVDTTSQSQNGV